VIILRRRKLRLSDLLTYAVLAIGAIILVISSLYASGFLVLFGSALIFWGVILLYLTPSIHVSIKILQASSLSSLENIEEILVNANSSGRGIYLPPRLLKTFNSSLVFVLQSSNITAGFESLFDANLSPKQNGNFVCPPGKALSQLFESELGVSFVTTDVLVLPQLLQKVIVEKMEIADSAKVTVQKNELVLEMKNNILSDICLDAEKMPKSHEAVGCLLSSAIACVLAQVLGKMVLIKKECLIGQVTHFEYEIIGD
jgi:hypothetical protein